MRQRLKFIIDKRKSAEQEHLSESTVDKTLSHVTGKEDERGRERGERGIRCRSQEARRIKELETKMSG